MMKEKLIIALGKEKKRFSDGGHNTEDHELAIHYLKTKEIKGDLDKFDLLDACVNDFECLCNDYNVK